MFSLCPVSLAKHYTGRFLHDVHVHSVSVLGSTGFPEKATAPHSSTLAWRIPGVGAPGGLPSMGSHRVGHD